MRRRELLRALALAPLVPACGGARIPDGELIDPGMALGHRMRDLDLRSLTPKRVAADAPILDVIIVGAGIAGLSAAWRLRRGKMRVTPSTVTCRSPIHSSKEACALGVARLISSANRILVKAGPGTN